MWDSDSGGWAGGVRLWAVQRICSVEIKTSRKLRNTTASEMFYKTNSHSQFTLLSHNIVCTAALKFFGEQTAKMLNQSLFGVNYDMKRLYDVVGLSPTWSMD